jgi:hypothetical protein
MNPINRTAFIIVQTLIAAGFYQIGHVLDRTFHPFSKSSSAKIKEYKKIE